MSMFRGLVLGVGGLALLEALVTGQNPDATGGALKLLSGGLTRWLDPSVPLIPDLRTQQIASPSNPIGKAPTGGAGGFINNITPIGKAPAAPAGGVPAKAL